MGCIYSAGVIKSALANTIYKIQYCHKRILTF